MGFFDSLNNEAKVEALNFSIQMHERELYRILVGLGLDAETFDADAWDEPVNMETAIGKVAHYITLIKDLREKVSGLG
jgi:hypothetical protein